jgi:glycosyltransferase involved in cell wall biosynthesis
MHIVADCPPKGTLDKIIDYFKDDERIKFTILPERYNDWGHTPRNYGLEHATEDWIIMTGEDNYYVPVFVDNMLEAVTSNAHFVFTNMVHNWLNFEYVAIDCQPKWGEIDMGNFMTKREYAQQMRLDVKNIQADGAFVDEYLQKFQSHNIIKINKFLYVHN